VQAARRGGGASSNPFADVYDDPALWRLPSWTAPAAGAASGINAAAVHSTTAHHHQQRSRSPPPPLHANNTADGGSVRSATGDSTASVSSIVGVTQPAPATRARASSDLYSDPVGVSIHSGGGTNNSGSGGSGSDRQRQQVAQLAAASAWNAPAGAQPPAKSSALDKMAGAFKDLLE
jgi:hypothetical protein